MADSDTMSEEGAHIADVLGYGAEYRLVLEPRDRERHIYVVGQTGVGKTTLLRNLALQDIEAGRGVCIIDPHGDLALDLLDHYPRWRARELVYLNPADFERPIGFNPLYRVPPDKRPLVAGQVVSSLRSIWGSSWGPRLEYILYCSLIALLDYGNQTLLGVSRLLRDEAYRTRITRKTEDPEVRAFWVFEFPRYTKGFEVEAIAPIQNKIGQLTTSAPIRNMLGQVKSTIDIRFMMDEERVLIVNLSKGKIGEDKANLLGSLLVSAFQLAALERAELPEEERRQFFLHVDEFHSFVTESFVGILSEARKYKLSLSLANQYLDQIPPAIRQAIFGNVATLVAFRVSAQDAKYLELELAPYRADTFSDLNRFEAVIRLTENGNPREPLRARTLAPLGNPHNRREKLIQSSREKYGTRRELIERKIKHWLG